MQSFISILLDVFFWQTQADKAEKRTAAATTKSRPQVNYVCNITFGTIWIHFEVINAKRIRVWVRNKIRYAMI